jgi:hypothetical protein
LNLLSSSVSFVSPTIPKGLNPFNPPSIESAIYPDCAATSIAKSFPSALSRSKKGNVKGSNLGGIIMNGG